MEFWRLYTKYYDLVDLLMRRRIPVYIALVFSVSLVLRLYNPGFHVLFQLTGYLLYAVIFFIAGFQLFGVFYQGYMLFKVGRRKEGVKTLSVSITALTLIIFFTLLLTYR